MTSREQLGVGVALALVAFWWVQRELDAGRVQVLEAQAEAAVTLRVVQARAARLDSAVRAAAVEVVALRRENAAIRATIAQTVTRVRLVPTDSTACLALADAASACAVNLERAEGQLTAAQAQTAEAQSQRDLAAAGLKALRDSVRASGLVGRKKWILGLPRPVCVAGGVGALGTDGRPRLGPGVACGLPL